MHLRDSFILSSLFVVTACPPNDSTTTDPATTDGTTSTTGEPTTGTTDDPTTSTDESSSDTTAESTDTTSAPVNMPPSAPEVSITPDSPTRQDDLSCTITAESVDPDGDPVTYAYAWTRDGMDAGITDPQVPADLLEVGQLWECTVTPSDGSLDGPTGAAQATIGAVCGGLDFDGMDDVITAGHVSADVWTIEAWVFPRSATGQQAIVTQLQSAGGFSGFELGIEGARPYVFAPDGVDFDGKVFPAEPLTLNEWHHLAGIYDGTSLRLAVDGVLDPNVVTTGFVDSDLVLEIGSRTNNDFYFDGEIYEVRVSSAARYTDNFTPAIGFLADADTLALYHLDEGTGAVAGDAADGANDGAIAGGAAWTTTCPAAGTASCAALGFDGTDDVVTADHVAAADAWTIEAWVAVGAKASQQAIISQLDSVGAFEGFELGVEGGKPYVFSPDGMDFNGKVTSDTALTQDEWHHLAGIYDGTSLRLAVDGVIDPAVVPTGFVDSDLPLEIGSRLNNNFFFDGTIARARISSVARYTANFAPSVHLAADVDTLGLWRLNEGQGLVAADSSSAANDGDIAGMAEWTMMCPSNLPKACISLDVDGIDDVVTADHLSAAEWTLEAWVFPQKGTGQQAIVTQLNSAMGKREGFEIGVENAVPYVFSPDGVDFDGKVVAADKLTLNQWHHIAGIYDGTDLRLAVDGVLVDTVVATGFQDSTLDLQIGARIANSFFFDGAISGVRVSSVARYTDDFTPPLAYAADADTLGLYRLEEGKGLVTVDGSGNVNTGDLVNGATWATICPP